jgi:predicted Zn-dependent protease with MMP-like domain
MGINLTVALVTEDGAINQEKSEQAFRTALVKHIAEHEVEQTLIAEKVSELFDQYKGTGINMPAVASMTAQKLNAIPENFKVISDRVLAYVRENSQGETLADETVERPNSLFVVAKGKNGGCFRRADRVAKVEATK